MAFTLGGFGLQRASIVVPHFGLWIADVSIVDEHTLTVGARVQIVAGDLVLSGVVRSGDTYFGESVFFVVGGLADGWSREVPAHAHRSDGGIQLAQVAGDLAAEVGERLVVEPGADRPLGYAWTRLAGPAVTALHDVVGSAWWAAPDGVTHVGPRPVVPMAPDLDVVLERYDPARRRAVLSSPTDALAALLPGSTWSADGVPSSVVGSAIFTLEGGRYSVEVIA